MLGTCQYMSANFVLKYISLFYIIRQVHEFLYSIIFNWIYLIGVRCAPYTMYKGVDIMRQREKSDFIIIILLFVLVFILLSK